MDNLAKKPSKSILRTLPTENYARKNAKFDEMNILATLHPPDKDYGHLKGDEDKTPYVFSMPADGNEFLDSDLLTMKLRLAANTQTPTFGDDEAISDDEFPETDEEKVQRIVFERRRKAHYNEYSGVKLARKLIEEDLMALDEVTLEVTTAVTPTDVSISGNEVESEEPYSEIETAESGSGGVDVGSGGGGVCGVGSSAKIDEAIKQEILIAPKPKEIEDLIDPSHPCYGRIIKQQEIRQKQQMRQEFLLQQQQQQDQQQQQQN